MPTSSTPPACPRRPRSSGADVGLVRNGNRNAYTAWHHRGGALTTIYNYSLMPREQSLTGRGRSLSALIGQYAGLPVGNLAPHSWMLPQKAGGMSMRATASGTLSADLYPTRAMSIDLTGAGDLEAAAGLVISMAMAMTGAGSFAAIIEGRLNMSADFTGTGDIDADMSGIAAMAVDLLGAGDLDATIAAYGDMAIDIVVTGTGLTTANVGGAVWNAIAANFNDAGTMGNKLNTASSGGVDLGALADAVRDELGVELSAILEVWRRHGLDVAAPLTQTADSITAGDISLAITGDPDTSVTVTREP